MLPTKSWPSYVGALRAVGERRFGGDAEEIGFLRNLRFVHPAEVALSDTGRAYFDASFIVGDPDRATALLRDAVSNLPEASLILQLLYGVAGADKSRADSVLRSRQHGDGLTDRKLSTLLVLMETADLIDYEPRGGKIHVLRAPTDRPTRDHVFVSNETPYGNRIWLRRVLETCDGFIYWLDKHFLPAALESIWEAADGERIGSIRVLSLKLADNDTPNSRRDYRNLKAELAKRGIDFEWRWIDSTLIRDTHDRWIIGKAQAWNVPNVNALLSGQNSEMLKTPRFAELRKVFEGYWVQATEVGPS